MAGLTKWIRVPLHSANKLITLLLLLISTTYSVAQDIQVDFQEATMEDIIVALESQIGSTINYSSSKLDTISRFSFSSIGTKEHILQVAMSVLDRQFSKLDAKNYVLSQAPPNADQKLLPDTYRIQLIDVYGDPLPFGLLDIKGKYTEADAAGNSVISGFWSYKENITVQYLGYKTRKVKLGALDRNKKNQIILQSDEQLLGEVVVSDQPITRSSQLDELVILPEKVSLAGFTDGDGLAISQQIAGVYNSTESLDDLQIRGGTPDQTQYTWNGIRLLQNSLFYGKIASVNPMMTNQIKVNKAGSTAGSENQSATSISNSTDLRNLEKISLSGYADFTHTNISVALPLLKNRVKLKTAFRKSMDLGLPWSRFNNFFDQSFQTGTLPDNEFYKEKFDIDSLIAYDSQFNFTDFSIAAEVDLSKKIKLNVFNLHVINDLAYEQTINAFEDPDLQNLSIENKGLGAEIEYKPIPNWTTKAFYRQSTYKYNANDYDDKFDIANSLKQEVLNKVVSAEIGLTSKLTLKQHHFDLALKQVHWDIDFSDIGYQDGNTSIYNQYENEASEVSLGLNYNFKKKWIEWNIGAQLSNYSKSDFRPLFVEPRLQLLLKPSNTFSIFANYGHYHQVLHKNNLFNPLIATAGFWYLADETEGTTDWYNIATTRQISIGVEKRFDNLSLILEAYRKRINDVWTSAYIFTYEEDSYVYVDTKALGLEFTFKYAKDGLSFYNTLNWTDEILFFSPSSSLKSPFYQPLRIGSTLSYNYKNWTGSLTWQFAIGRFYSVPSGFEEEQVGAEDVNYTVTYDDLLTAQSPNYHRLDLSVYYTKELKKISFKTGLGILNLYNRQNVISNQYYTDYRLDDIQPSLFTRYGVPVTPEVFVKVGF